MRLTVVFAILGVLDYASAAVYNLTLPWGIWQSTYNDVSNVYTFKNVRFGAAPVGNLRFQAAQPPLQRSSAIMTGSDASCLQVNDTAGCAAGGNSTVTPPKNITMAEDCLFLDIYVPASVLQNAQRGIANASVAVWIYGGAFLFGSKDSLMEDAYNTPFYNGTGILQQADYPTVIVAGNYRLGAFGWLAGTTMERTGYPNAGLSDQRLMFDFVARYISQVGGDKSKVSAWGESAGASSILHHLISRTPNNQQLVPQFQRAAVQSPAFEWIWNRTAYMEQTFINYTNYVCLARKDSGCTPPSQLPQKARYSIAQLSNFSEDALSDANLELFQNTYSCTGLFPVGPSVDGNVIRHLAPIELGNNRIAKLDSLIVSHVQDEAASFVGVYNVSSAKDIDYVIQELFTGDALVSVRKNIQAQYPIAKYANNATECLKAIIQDGMFLSNARLLIDAYSRASTPVYALLWDGLAIDAFGFGDFSYHATDLVPLFYNSAWNLYGYMIENYKKLKDLPKSLFDSDFLPNFVKQVSTSYKKYWTAHAATGSPNTPGLVPWNRALPALDGIGNTLQIKSSLSSFKFSWALTSISDTLLSATMSNFWLTQAAIINNVTATSMESQPDEDIFADTTLLVNDDQEQIPLLKGEEL